MTLIKTPGSIDEKPEEKNEGGMTMALQFLQEDQEGIALKPAGLLSLKDVVKGAGAFAMREIDSNNLESLVCSDPASWPPICVTKSSMGYIYYDGQHRIQASKLLKRETILAACKTFTNINDLIEAAFRANLKHGLQSSQETKSDYCYWLSVAYPNLNQQQIAVRVGVTQSTVSRAIERRKKQIQEATQNGKQPQKAEEEQEEDGMSIEQWKEGVVRRARTFVKSIARFSESVKAPEEYSDLVRDLQLELVHDLEDRQVLLFTGQLLLDTANKSKYARKGKIV